MNAFLSILGGLGSGGLLGLLGSLATGWLELKRAAQANAHELAMIQARSAAAREAADGAAFAASQQSASSDAAVGAASWAVTLRVATRPGLTWLLVAAAVVLSWRAGSASDLPLRVLFLAEMAVGWWFGSRSTFSAKK
jgi:hypothetical protein